MSISGKAVICTNPHKFVPYIFSVLQSCYLWETELTYVLPKGKSPKIGECYTVTKSGDLEISDQADRKETERLLAELASRGYAVPDTTEPESKGLTVQMPADFFTEHTLGNLRQLCENKAALFHAAFQTDCLDIILSDEKVEFPWFTVEQDGDADAYCTFIFMLCEFAKNQSRINRKPDTSDNPKYTMRCFLIRLGMVGAEFKAARKVILRHLSGNSAFRKVGDTDAVSE